MRSEYYTHEGQLVPKEVRRENDGGIDFWFQKVFSIYQIFQLELKEIIENGDKFQDTESMPDVLERSIKKVRNIEFELNFEYSLA